MSTFQPPPTWADPVLIEKDPLTGQNKSKFNPVWLKWFIDLVQSVGAGGAGNVFGPASSVANDIAIFSDATGKTLSDSGVLISSIDPSDMSQVISKRVFSRTILGGIPDQHILENQIFGG